MGTDIQSSMRDTTFRRPIEWQSGSVSHRGCVRELNEDAMVSKPSVGLWAVADGMGGHRVGDVASRMIVDALEQVSFRRRLSDLVDEVELSLRDVNNSIIEYAELMFEDGATMGSTVVGLLICGHVGICLWAGDSRLYRLRNQQLSQLSCDHSHVQELIQMGAIEPEEAEGHPHANVITRAVGVEADVMIDLNVFNTQIGDVFVLCSDGLYNTVSNEQMSAILQQNEPQAAAEALLAAALDAGAPDNVSVIVIRGEPGRIASRNEDE